MAATTERLGDLHSMLTEDIIATIKGIEVVDIIKDKDGNEEAVTRILKASPADRAVAAKFLKDNAITASPGERTGLEELNELLKRRSVPTARDRGEALKAIGSDLLS